MRLIDADTLIDFIDCGHLRNPGERCFTERDIVDMLEARPLLIPWKWCGARTAHTIALLLMDMVERCTMGFV